MLLMCCNQGRLCHGQIAHNAMVSRNDTCALTRTPRLYAEAVLVGTSDYMVITMSDCEAISLGAGSHLHRQMSSSSATCLPPQNVIGI